MTKEVDLPDGTVGEFPDNMSDEAIAAVLKKQYAPKPPVQVPSGPPGSPGFRGPMLPQTIAAQTPTKIEATPPVDPKYENMPFYEKFGRGAVGDAKSLYRGAMELIGKETPEDIAASEEWKKESEGLGGWGTAGGIAGQAIATLPLTFATGGVGTALAHLPKVGKAIQAAGQLGGRYFNLGRAAAAGTEGALSAGIAKPEEGDTRLGNMIQAGAVGTVAPSIITGASAIVRPIAKAVVPTMKNAQSRAYTTFEKTLGKQDLDLAEQAVRNAPPARVPQTTAAVADSPRLGAMEGGARNRNTQAAGFEDIDRQQAVDTFNKLVNDTSSIHSAEHIAKRADKIKATGSAILDKAKVDDGARTVLEKELDPVLHSNEVWQNPALKNEITKVLGALQTPGLTVQGLKVHYDRLGKFKGVPAVDKVRESLSFMGNAYSNDVFSRMDDAALKVSKDLDDINAANKIRQNFRSDAGTVTGQQRLYKVGGEDIPAMKAADLRDALIAQESKLDPERYTDIKGITETLRKRELFNPTADVGGSKLDIGDLRGPVSRAVSSTGAWKARPLVDLVTGAANRKTLGVVDEALADPQKFIALMDAKKLRGAPLSAKEKFMMQMLVNAPARSFGASQGE